MVLDDNGDRLGYDLNFLGLEEKQPKPVARRNPFHVEDGNNEFEVKPEVPRFVFDPKAFEMACEHLTKCEGAGIFDVFVLEELGWLENDGQGHYETVKDILDKQCSKGKDVAWLFSARYGLAEAFVEKLKDIVSERADAHAKVVEVDGKCDLKVVVEDVVQTIKQL
ncbi:hypothetical protein AKO1_015262 [Acrasis kona]|uniref:Uncharacterized protein n=1 Tax=Acrasis kona TaxID=1008807 RepID=A0AAW2ZFG1_9EUKA